MVDARLLDGSRVNAMLPPVAVDSPVLTIRRFPAKPFTMSDLIRLGAVTPDAGLFLEAAVLGRLNMIVSGGTGTGKTTLLNILGDFVPVDERIITIEDAAEIRLSQPHVVRMEARPANIEGVGQIGIRELVRNALRMRPDRIIVGEVRGGEALDMLQAMNTGHEGSLTTVHSNSPRDALTRLDTMVMMAGYDLPVRAIRQQVAAALDVVIQIQRFGDGSRRITHISEIQGMEGDIITLQDIFRYSFAEGGSASATSSGILKPTGLRPKVIEKLQDKGVDVPARLFRPRTEAPTAAAGNRIRSTQCRKEAIEMMQLASILLIGAGIAVCAVGCPRARTERNAAFRELLDKRAGRADQVAAGHIQADGEGGRIRRPGDGAVPAVGKVRFRLIQAGSTLGPESSGRWWRWCRLSPAALLSCSPTRPSVAAGGPGGHPDAGKLPAQVEGRPRAVAKLESQLPGNPATDRRLAGLRNLAAARDGAGGHRGGVAAGRRVRPGRRRVGGGPAAARGPGGDGRNESDPRTSRGR